MTLLGIMLGGPHVNHDRPDRTMLTWLVLVTLIVLFAPNSREIVSRLQPSRLWAFVIVALFLVTAYHFDQTTEFLYYQF